MIVSNGSNTSKDTKFIGTGTYSLLDEKKNVSPPTLIICKLYRYFEYVRGIILNFVVKN